MTTCIRPQVLCGFCSLNLVGEALPLISGASPTVKCELKCVSMYAEVWWRSWASGSFLFPLFNSVLPPSFLKKKTYLQVYNASHALLFHLELERELRYPRTQLFAPVHLRKTNTCSQKRYEREHSWWPDYWELQPETTLMSNRCINHGIFI